VSYTVFSALYRNYYMIIGRDSIKPDPDKLEVIKNAKAPTNAKLLKSFLLLCSFFRRFIRGFSQICKPFRDLLKKNAPFVWKIEHQNAFDTLKKAMTSAPICLGMPRWKDTFIITSDSSCGFIITNRDEKGVERVVTYGGRLSSKHEANYSISELELAGILYCVESYPQFFRERVHYSV